LTRINIVEPSELTDQHLVAEYREIFMVGSSLQRSLKSKSWDIKSIPQDSSRVFKREQWPDELWNEWMPLVEDYKIIRQRIEEKIRMKPDWYRFTKKERSKLKPNQG